MIFWRILDNELYSVDEVEKLGFEKSDGLVIPDDYLDKKEFMIMRTAHGIGDLGIITAMPRLLKEKYPDCRVVVPTPKLLEKLFGEYAGNWNSWNNPFSNVVNVFENNPYVDEFVDEIEGEVFHDHYRVYDNENIDIPLVEQMLKFWQFDEDECKDSQPELYWSEEEKELGDSIIKEYVGDEDYGCLLISDRYDYTMDKLIIDVINPKLKHFYWTEKPIEQTDFDFIDKALDMRNMSVRIQLYIKSKAKYNVGNQCGTSQLVTRYSDVYSVQRQFPIAHNFVRNEIYLDDEYKRFHLHRCPDKFESKTTTTLKFKADLVDFLGDDYKDKNIVEIGCSLGYTSYVLSGYFNKVTAVDYDPSRIQSAREFGKDKDNMEFIVKDVYGTAWDFDKDTQVVFIDCVHDYPFVRNDIINAINYFDKPLLIFDDYGLFPHSVMKCIDEFISQGVLKLVKKIGHKKGVIIPKTAHKILKDYEGIICQVM